MVSLCKPAVHDFDGVEGMDAGAVEDLLAAGGAGCGNQSGGLRRVVLCHGLADGREEDHLAYGE